MNKAGYMSASGWEEAVIKYAKPVAGALMQSPKDGPDRRTGASDIYSELLSCVHVT